MFFLAGTSFLLSRIDKKIPWRSMFLFGLLQGVFQWLTSLDRSMFPANDLIVEAFKYIIFIGSFVALADFGFSCFVEGEKKSRYVVAAILLLCAAVSGVMGEMIVFFIILLCAVSTIATACGLFVRVNDDKRLKLLFGTAGIMFLLFGSLAWIVYPGIYYHLNNDAFFRMTGIPSVVFQIIPVSVILFAFASYYNRLKHTLFADDTVSGHFCVIAGILLLLVILGFIYIDRRVDEAGKLLSSECNAVPASIFSRYPVGDSLRDFIDKGTSGEALVHYVDNAFDRIGRHFEYAFVVVNADGKVLKYDRSALLARRAPQGFPIQLLSGATNPKYHVGSMAEDRNGAYAITRMPSPSGDPRQYFFVTTPDRSRAMHTVTMFRQSFLVAIQLLAFLVVAFWIAYVNNEDVNRHLSKARHEYAGLIEMQRDIIVRFNPDYKFTFVNNVFCQAVGRTRELLLGNDIGKVFDWEYFLYDIRTMPPDGCVKFIVPMALHSGTGWHEWLVTKVNSFQPSKYEFQAVGRDVTKLQETMSSLQQSEKKYRQVVDLANEGIWVIDSNSITTFANQRMAEILGVNLDELIGSPLDAYVGNNEKDALKNNLDRRKRGISERHDFIFTRRDGKTVSTTLATTPMYDDHGKFVGALAIVVDITRFRQLEDNLKTLNNELRNALSFNQLVLDNDPNLIYVTDRNQNLIMANKAFSAFFNCEPPEIKGKVFLDVIGTMTVSPSPGETDREVVAAMQRRAFEEQIFMDSDRHVWFRTVKTPLILPDGNVGILCISMDITKMKEAENRQEQVNHELEEKVARRTNSLNKTIRKLTREVSSKQELQRLLQKESERIQERLGQNLHDVLGQMLTAISIKANVLRDILPQNEHRKYAEVIAEYTGEAISQMRNLAKTLSYVNIRKLGLEMGMNDFKDFINKFYNVDVYMNIDNDVIELLEEEAQNNLFRIIQESIVNAIKHSNAKNITLDLRRDNENHGCLHITSDGTEYIDQEMNRSEGIGVLIMETRAAVMGAALRLEKNVANGLDVICRFPLNLRKESDDGN